MNGITDFIFELIIASMQIYVLMIFFNAFCQQRFEGLKCAAIMLLSGIFALVINYMYAEDFLYRVLLGTIVAYMVSFAYKLKWGERIIWSLLSVALLWVSELIVTALLFKLFLIDWGSNSNSVMFILGIFLSKVVAVLIVICIRSRLKKKNAPKPPKRSYLVPISLASIAFSFLICFYLQTLQTTVRSVIIVSLVCSTAFTFMNMVVFGVIDQLYLTAEREAELMASKEIINQQTLQYEQLVDSNREITKLRHDYNNFTLGLISEIESGNYQSALSSLYKQLNTLKESSELSKGKDVLHLLINQKSKQAAQKGIMINFDYHELQKIVISPIDMSIVIGNALDNAIEASQMLTDPLRKKIMVQAKVHNDNIVIIIKNNVVENINTDDLRTTKKEKDKHGFGIAGIKQIVQKYEGDVFFICEELVFETRIMMKNVNT